MSAAAVQELPGFASASNADVCNWYFFVFVFVALVITARLIVAMLQTGFAKVPIVTKVVALLIALATTGFVIANAGFQFTMCKRALSV